MTNWVKCSDRMPVPRENVLVVTPYFREVEIARLSDNGERWFPVGDDDIVPAQYTSFDGTKTHYYTHWMPLPEPPADEE